MPEFNIGDTVRVVDYDLHHEIGTINGKTGRVIEPRVGGGFVEVELDIPVDSDMRYWLFNPRELEIVND